MKQKPTCSDAWTIWASEVPNERSEAVARLEAFRGRQSRRPAARRCTSQSPTTPTCAFSRSCAWAVSRAVGDRLAAPAASAFCVPSRAITTWSRTVVAEFAPLLLEHLRHHVTPTTRLRPRTTGFPRASCGFPARVTRTCFTIWPTHTRSPSGRSRSRQLLNQLGTRMHVAVQQSHRPGR